MAENDRKKTAVRRIAPVAPAWTDTRFVSRAHLWLRDTAARNGYAAIGEIDQPHVRPWSTVFRARTARGAIFLKCCGASQAHEPRLTELLARVAAQRVPTLIARHPREDWMLVTDGGRRIRDVATSATELLRMWPAILASYAEIQIATIGREHDILATGTPDRRLDRLADDVEEMLRTVVFDWGDACLTHPFLSLTIALRFAAYRAKTSESDRRITRLRDAYLEPFERFAAPMRLRRAAGIARRLGVITRAQSWYRVITLVGAEDVGEESLAAWLRMLPRAFRPSGGT